MTRPGKSALAALAIVSLLLSGVTAIVGAQVNSRPIKPAEQAFVDRLASDFGKILPRVPSGWTEVERRIFDAGGSVSDWDAPIQADYEVQLVASDIEERQKIVQKREEDSSEKNKDAFEAAAARNQKLMDEFGTKLGAAAARNDTAAMRRLQADFEKNMDGGAKGSNLPTVDRKELSDSYARIRVQVNPYHAPVLAEKRLTAPAGFVWVGRRERDENNAEKEGVTRYLLGAWTPNANSGYTLKYTPNKGAVAYGIIVEIEARADRADALFRAMNSAALQAMLR